MPEQALSALDRARQKAYWRLVPLCFICYVIAYIDRVNVSFVKLKMVKALPGFDDDVCIPVRSFLLAELAIVPVIAIDAAFLSRAVRREEGFRGLPLQPSLAVTADGRPWLSLSGRL